MRERGGGVLFYLRNDISDMLRLLPSSCRPEGLDGVELVLLHACRLSALDDGDGLARVDLVRGDGVAVQVSDGLDLKINIGILVGFHK